MAAFAWRVRAWALAVACAAAVPAAQAGLFDDEEARKAILDLRTRLTEVEARNQRLEADQNDTKAQLGALRRSVLELNGQLELLRGEMAKLRGSDEQVLRDISDLQRTQKDANQNFDDRLRRLEPQKVSLDGREFPATPEEKRAYDDAIAAMRGGNFDAAASALEQFEARFPSSGYLTSARFWLGNALYGKRDYKGAINAFRAVVKDAPDHPKAPEALLALANSQAEMKDTKAARRTIEELLKAYPQSEAALAGKDRLKSLK
jgi:tol-pal system protein YbgF